MSEASRGYSSQVQERPGGAHYFDRARSVAAAALLAAGGTAIVGAVLDWVTITPPPGLRSDADFGGATVPEPAVTAPFTGIEAGDGWWVVGGGVAMLAAAVLLVVRKRSAYGWLGLLASVVIGSIAFADFRGIGDLSSSLSQRMDIVGAARPAVGIMLVAASALVGLVASAAGIAASPPPRP